MLVHQRVHGGFTSDDWDHSRKFPALAQRQVLDHLHLQGDQVRHALEAALAGGLGAGERLLSAARGNNFQAVGPWGLGMLGGPNFGRNHEKPIMRIIMIHDTWYMIHDTWYMIHDTWYMIHDTWYMIHDTWYMIHDTWYMIHDTWHMIHDTWYMIHDTWDMTHDTWYMIQSPTELWKKIKRFNLQAPPVYDRKVTNLFFSIIIVSIIIIFSIILSVTVCPSIRNLNAF